MTAGRPVSADQARRDYDARAKANMPADPLEATLAAIAEEVREEAEAIKRRKEGRGAIVPTGPGQR